MKLLKNITLYRYQIPLLHPLKIGKEILKERSGLLIELQDEKGKIAWGEIAPLPGLSRETEEEAILEVKSLKNLLLTQEWKSLDPLPKNLSPSVLFGVETAIYKLISCEFSLKELPLCSLLWGRQEEIFKNAESQKSSIVKVKVGDYSLKDAISLIKKLKKFSFGLRVDVNQKWNLKEALEFASHFSPSDFVYIEEPLSKFSDLIKFSKKTNFPIAIDESLKTEDFRKFSKKFIPSLKALVLKPTILGGIRKIQEISKNIDPEINLVFSSSFETGVGLSAIAKIAHLLTFPIEPLGLDTHRFLKNDLLKSKIDFSNGKIYLPSIQQIKKQKLCPSFSTQVSNS